MLIIIKSPSGAHRKQRTAVIAPTIYLQKSDVAVPNDLDLASAAGCICARKPDLILPALGLKVRLVNRKSPRND